MSTATPPAQPAASRVVPTQEAYRVLKEWADAHPQDQNHDKVVDELAELADPTVWDDESRAAEVAGRLNVLLASARIGVWTAAAVPAPNSTPAPAQPAPITQPAAPTTTPAPAQPAPGPRPSWLATWAALAAWQRLVAASAVIVLILAAAAAGAAAGLAAIAAAAAGASIGIGSAIAAVAIRRGGGGAIAAAAGLVAIAAAAAGLVASGRVSLSGGNVAALLAGAGLAGLLAGGQGIVAAMKVAADKDGTQRPQR